jgi:Cu/Ag efflux protein CusF
MMIRSTRRLGFSFALAAALLLPGSASAEHHEGEAAERAVVLGEKITRHGKVVSIDAKARTVTVEGEQGRQVSIVAPEDAPNFDKIKVGDPVVATYYESVALAIAPVADAEPGLSGAVALSTAAPGETPSATVAEQIQLRAVVKAVDPEARSVTLDVPEGGERTLKAGEAIDLEKVKVGEQVSVTLTRALAISIDRK